MAYLFSFQCPSSVYYVYHIVINLFEQLTVPLSTGLGWLALDSLMRRMFGTTSAEDRWYPSDTSYLLQIVSNKSKIICSKFILD
jgi:hypothetical protein